MTWKTKEAKNKYQREWIARKRAQAKDEKAHREYKKYRCPYPGITCNECINVPKECIEAGTEKEEEK